MFSTRKVALAIFVLAFLIRVAEVFATHQYRDQERFEPERVAISLATTGVFGNPYAIPTGPTAHLSPAFPLLLAAIFRVFGTGTSAEIVKQVFACACSACVCAVIPFVGRYVSMPAVVSAGAGLFTALVPLKIRTETEGDWEAPFAALALMLVICLAVSTWRQRKFSFSSAIQVGLAWGVVLLFVSAFLPLLMALLLAGVFAARSAERRSYLKFAMLTCVCAFAVLTPWALRNWIALGWPIIGRDNAGIELRISNNDYAGPSESRNYENGVYHRFHPTQSATEAARIRDMGEVAYNQAAIAEAKQWIFSHPGRFLRLTLQRAEFYWFYPEALSWKSLKALASLSKAAVV